MIALNSGLVGQVPFVLIDMEQTDDKNTLRQVLFDKAGVITDIKSGTFFDNAQYFDIPLIWQDSGKMALLADNGVALAVRGGFDGTFTQIKPNGYFATSYYAKTKTPLYGAVYLAMNDIVSDISVSYKKYRCQNGVLFECEWTGGTNGYFLFTDGGCFFFYDTQDKKARIGTFMPDTVFFNQVGVLEPLTLYAIRSNVSYARGKTFDPAGRITANCRVFAYRRDTGERVGQAVSSQTGDYEMPLNATKGVELFMVCLDNDTAPDFEAQVIDRITVA